jgi:DNA topoisomerase I
MGKNLLIVESPAKAKTIQKYLGPDFEVKSSYGHIRDLDKGTQAVDIDNGFEPRYIVPLEKRKLVKELRDASMKASEVWLATDEDREGEAISWHLCDVLELDPKLTKRITFSEITKPAIQKAVANPRTLDLDLVNAQQARRILDRLVGYELSEVLWRKVKGKLSAGRVQSVAVKLIVEREREITTFKTENYYKVNATFDVKGRNGERAVLNATLKNRLDNIADAQSFVNKANGAVFKIEKIEKKPTSRKPAAPFTTSTLQQEASRKLYFGVNRTMSTAQRLYEAGHITYMRTDSTNLSDQALGTIANQINHEFGERYLKVRKYKNKTANAQEAHEAIRPTYIENKSIEGTLDEQKLYDLIRKRTIASQMADAELEKTQVDISISTINNATLTAEGEVIKFDGFLAVYMESSDDDNEDGETKGMLPPLSVQQILDLNQLTATEKYTQPPARYTEASLIQKLEELGIGRPSTYAPTITKIMEEDRGYVTKESREGVERKYAKITLKNGKVTESVEKEITGATSNRLYASDLGMIVTDFLDANFDEVMNYKFTAEVESKLDEVSNGTFDWKKMLQDFYFPFRELIKDTKENASRAKGKRELGVDPVSGHKVLVQITRYGPVVQIGDLDELPEGVKPRFANLNKGQSMETITFNEAIELFKLPRSLGEFNGGDLQVNNGRFGPYIKLGEVYANLGKGVDPMSISREDAIEIISGKLKENEPITSYKSVPITKGKGRFGPFVKWGDLFVNVPAKINFDNISPKEAIDLVEAKIEKESNRYIQHWPEAEISIENGRWGPYIKYKRANIKVPKVEGNKLTDDNLRIVNLEQVKQWIETEMPGTFSKNAKAATAKPAAKKAVSKKPPAKKATSKK